MNIQELIDNLEYYKKIVGPEYEVKIRLDGPSGDTCLYDVFIDHTDSGSEFDCLCIEPKHFN